jgi:2,4-dienoyl-CoA reductase-like NADH-dependent reductase (Old Yellow Enzyme family)
MAARSRLAIEITEACRAEVGPDFPADSAVVAVEAAGFHRASRAYATGFGGVFSAAG